MNIASIMTKQVVKVDMDESLQMIRNIFKKYGFHHLLVMDGKTLTGVISDRDLLREISPFIETSTESHRDMSTLSKKAHQIMSREPITIKADVAIANAANMFFTHKISCLPVTTMNGVVEGIVTMKDVLLHYVPQKNRSKKGRVLDF